MTSEPSFLSVDDVLAIHARMIAEFGGDSGLRDRGLLESAVHMPSAQFGGRYLHEGLAAMAAAYLFHLCLNHPFIDGKKRVALGAAEIFLQVNGLRLKATDAQVADLTIGVAEGRISKAEATAFFARRVARDIKRRNRR
jgi:death-on-curing protein